MHKTYFHWSEVIIVIIDVCKKLPHCTSSKGLLPSLWQCASLNSDLTEASSSTYWFLCGLTILKNIIMYIDII